MVCEINGELWVIDFKTSNHLQTTYDLQTAMYAKCFEECFGKKVDRTGVLWLKSSKRGPKKDKIQGKGWEMYESKRTQEDNLNIYRAVRTLFDIENPNHKPAFTEFEPQLKEICNIYNKYSTVKLYDILKEIQGKPKAIILAGAPGAGKGYILRGLDLGGLKILNVDDIYVPMLKKG